MKAPGAAEYLPDTCDLYRDAEQVVFGAGTPSAVMMLVGNSRATRRIARRDYPARAPRWGRI